MTREELMNDQDKNLIEMVKTMPNKNCAAILLQSVIQVRGPVGNEAGEEIKKIIKELPDD